MISLIFGRIFDLLIMISALIFTLVTLALAKKASEQKKQLFGGIRSIEAVKHIEELAGRCAEMGTPLHFTAGLGLITDTTCTANVVAGLAILGTVADACAKKGIPLIVTTSDAGRMALEASIVQEAYLKYGNPELYNPDNIRYVSRDQFSYTLGVVSNIIREKCAANIMTGYFYVEDVYISEVGVRSGCMQIGGPNLIFVLTCDYFMIGEELFAAGAAASQDPVLVGSIASEDMVKMYLIALIIIGVVLSFFGIQVISNLIKL